MTETPSWLPPKWLPPVPAHMLPDGSRLYSGCSYAIATGFRPLQLDVRVPVGEGPFPAVVWVHGGGYNMGDRRTTPIAPSVGNLFDMVVGAGIALITIDYRLGYEAQFPGAVHDAKAALRWIARYARELGIDAERVGIWGESAGGHLAGFTATTQGNPVFDGDLGVRGGGLQLRAFVSWYGAMDLPTIVRPQVTPELEQAMGGKVPDFLRFPPEYFNLGADRYQDMELRRAASPITHVTSAMVPSLFIHGEADRLVPIQQSEVMVQRLRDAGCDVTFVRIPDADHVWMGIPDATVAGIIRDSVAFLAERL